MRAAVQWGVRNEANSLNPRLVVMSVERCLCCLRRSGKKRPTCAGSASTYPISSSKRIRRGEAGNPRPHAPGRKPGRHHRSQAGVRYSKADLVEYVAELNRTGGVVSSGRWVSSRWRGRPDGRGRARSVRVEVTQGCESYENQRKSTVDDVHRLQHLRPPALADVADRPPGRRCRQAGASGDLRRICRRRQAGRGRTPASWRRATTTTRPRC